MPNPNNNYRGGGPNNYGRQQDQDAGQKVRDFLTTHPFKNAWITAGADQDMIKFCEEAGMFMAKGTDKEKLTTSQIRNIFGEIKRIQLKGISDPEGKSSFMLLKPKVAYAEGRQDKNAKGMKLFRAVFDKAWECVGNDEKTFNNFCNFIEAILAYHKANGGK